MRPWIVATAGVLAAGSTALGAEVSFRFTGSIVSGTISSGIFIGAAPGVEIRLDLTYESTTAPSSTTSTTQAAYTTAVTALSIDVGPAGAQPDFTATPAQLAVFKITVQNGAADGFALSNTAPLGFNIMLTLFDSSATAFSSTALPTSLDLTEFGGRLIQLTIPGSALVFASVTSITQGIDADGDGLSDSDELARGTDPNDPDSDDDGLNDGLEVSLAGAGACPSPLDSDSDDDGLSDGAESATGTNRCLADTDGDGLSDGQEVAAAGGGNCPSPINPDSDADGLSDNAEFLLGTESCAADSDGDGLGDGLEVALAGAGTCPSPLDDDSDNDGLSDGDEDSLHGTDFCLADTDGDDLDDGDEVDVHGTNPHDADSDDDGLGDGLEVSLAAGGPCPSPTDSDSDDDGLSDSAEASVGTARCVADTDGDGLGDGLEVALADGGGCPDPTDSDSDGDTLSDGAEMGELLKTNPCLADTDGDGVDDNVDDLPLEPGVTTGLLEDLARDAAGSIDEIDLSSFEGNNANAAMGRQVCLANRVRNAANAIAEGDLAGALDLLGSVYDKIDGEPIPPDWMPDSPEREALAAEVQLLIALILLG